jgi:hypothetical protein
MNKIATVDTNFSLPAVGLSQVNTAAVAKVHAGLAEMDDKTRAFDRNNSQHTLSLMTLTMLGGQSPMRMMRQVMAEVETRKTALSESQVSHAKSLDAIDALREKEERGILTRVEAAELRNMTVGHDMLEAKINGSFKDIAQLITCYENIKETNGIDDWDEQDYENAEKLHHVRRGFELMYRNLMNTGRMCTSTIEYMQQYGVHPQVGVAEVSGYIAITAQRVIDREPVHANDLEDFLDEMGAKYVGNVEETSKRIFGKSSVTNPEFMLRLEKTNDT